MIAIRRHNRFVTSLLLLGACARSEPQEGVPLSVPSDPNARYFVLEKAGTPERPTIVTRRTGSSGTTFSRREVDCASRTWRSLGTGDTKEQMNAGPADPKMTELVQGSIADVVLTEACKR